MADPNRRRAMAAALKARREALRERMRRQREARPKKKPDPRKRRRWLLLLLLVLLLAILCCCCGLSPEPVPPPPEVGVPEAGLPLAEAPVPEPLTGHVEKRPRPDFATPPPAPLPWLASFRLQVTARSPRLAACFAGSPQPGTLKWTAAVEPGSGRVSDATLEATLQSDPLTSEQRACALGVLANPPYHLEAGEGERSTPSRVSLAIEF